MKRLFLLFLASLLLGNGPALVFEPVTISQANRTPELTQLESDFSTFQDVYQDFAHLCAKYDRYFYREGLVQKEPEFIAQQAFKETYKYADNLPQYELKFHGYLPRQGELFFQAASKATGNVHIDSFSEVLRSKFPRGKEFRRAKKGVSLSLQTLAANQGVLLYTGLAKTAKTQKHVVVFIVPNYQQVLLIQTGFCN